MPNPFIDTTTLGDYLGRDLSADNAATLAVEGACDIVRTVTEQALDEVSNEQIALDGTGTDALLLPQLPVTAVISVTEGDTVLVTDEDYLLDATKGLLLRLPSVVDDCYVTKIWRKGRQNIAVTYSHGYSATTLPNDLRVVATTIAARLLAQQNGGISLETLGAYTVRYDNAQKDYVTKQETAILRKYRVSK